MVWHIFRKDWKLLWHFALAVAVMEVAAVTVLFERGHFDENRLFSSLLQLLQISVYVGEGCLIAAVVHQDAIPGIRQDWLVRPIKRRDLLLAKLLFVLLAIQVPLLIADLCEGLTNGFPFAVSLAAAVSQNLHFLVGFSIPILALVSLTRNLTEAITVGIVVFAGFMGLGIIIAGLTGNGLGATNNSGIEWIPEAGRYLVSLMGAVCILGLQYFRRRTVPSRYAFGAMVFLCIMTALVPWEAAFALQERFSAQARIGDHVAIGFEPGLGSFQPPSHVELQGNVNKIIREARTGGITAYIPLRITGLPDDSILKLDRSIGHIVSRNGSAETLSVPNDLGDDLEVHNDGSGKTERLTHQAVRMRGNVYDRVKDEPVRLEIDYSFTLMKLSAAYALPALDGDERFAETGWCKTRLNESATAVEVRCLEAGKSPFHCASFFLENPIKETRNPARLGCGDDYQPYFGHYQPIDIITRVGANLPFHDMSGLAKYPVDGSQLAQAQAVIRLYRAQDHFTRRLVIPEIRLGNWMPR
jgi:hypothetical protein